MCQELLAAVDSRPWHHLAKRRVQHYGYAFCYEVSSPAFAMSFQHIFISEFCFIILA